MKQNRITIATSRRIAKNVLRYVSRVDPRTVDMNAQINGWLADVDLGWTLDNSAYLSEEAFIDGISSQFIGALAKDIRAHAVEINRLA